MSLSPGLKINAYLLYGKEEFLKREFIQKVRTEQGILSQSSSDSFREFNAGEDSVKTVVQFLQLNTFFDSKKIAVLWALDELLADEKEELSDFLPQLPKEATLFLMSDQTNTKKNSFLKELSLKTQAIACHSPFDKDLPRWVESSARTFGKNIERDAVGLVIERVGRSLTAIYAALEELSLYCHPEHKITVNHVESLLGKSFQADAFRLAGLLLDKRLKSSFENLEVLLREGTKIYEIIGALAGELDRLSKARLMVDEGFSDEVISRELKLHPFFAGKILQEAKKPDKSFFEKALKELLICDEMVKTGRLEERLALQSSFLKICL